MNTPTTPACQCVNCSGASCRCGCRSVAATAPAAAATRPACNCGSRCGCDAAEQGCLCATRTA